MFVLLVQDKCTELRFQKVKCVKNSSTNDFFSFDAILEPLIDNSDCKIFIQKRFWMQRGFLLILVLFYIYAKNLSNSVD